MSIDSRIGDNEGFQFKILLKYPSIRFDAILGSCMVEYHSQQ